MFHFLKSREFFLVKFSTILSKFTVKTAETALQDHVIFPVFRFVFFLKILHIFYSSKTDTLEGVTFIRWQFIPEI